MKTPESILSKEKPIFRSKFNRGFFSIPDPFGIVLLFAIQFILFAWISYLLFTYDAAFWGLILILVIAAVDISCLWVSLPAGVLILQNGTIIIESLKFGGQKHAEVSSIVIEAWPFQLEYCVIFPKNILSARLMSSDEKRELANNSFIPLAFTWKDYLGKVGLVGSLRRVGRFARYIPNSFRMQEMNEYTLKLWLPYVFLKTVDLSQDIIELRVKDTLYTSTVGPIFGKHLIPELIFYVAVKDSVGLLSSIERR